LKDKPKGVPCVAREKIDSFTEEDWKILDENFENGVNKVSIRKVVFGLGTRKDCT